MFRRFFNPMVFSEFRQSWTMAFPLIISNIVQMSSGFLGTVMIAHLGRDQLAAQSLGWSIYITLLVFYFGITASVGILVSQSFGARDNEGVRLSVAQGFLTVIVLGIPAVLFLLFPHWVLVLAGQNPHITLLATKYMQALAFCIIPLGFLVIIEQFLIGISKTRLVLLISLVQVPFEIISIYAFIYGKFGLPAFGIQGVGYGIAAVFVAAALVLSLLISFSKATRHYRIFSEMWRINLKFFVEIFRVGWPIGAMNMIEVALMAVIAILMGHISSTALAAQQITRQYWLTGMMIAFSIAQAAAVRVGQAVGKGDGEAINRAAYVNIMMGLFLMLVVTMIYLTFPHQLIEVDLSQHEKFRKELLSYATIFLAFASVSQLFDTVRFIVMGALRGLKDTRFPMYVSLIAFWVVALPSAYFFAFNLHFGGAGLWMGLLLGVFVGAATVMYRLKSLLKSIDISTLVTRS